MGSAILNAEETWLRIERLTSLHEDGKLESELSLDGLRFGQIFEELCYVSTYAEEEHASAIARMLAWKEMTSIDASLASGCVLDALARIGGEPEIGALKEFRRAVRANKTQQFDRRDVVREEREKIVREIQRTMSAIKAR